MSRPSPPSRLTFGAAIDVPDLRDAPPSGRAPGEVMWHAAAVDRRVRWERHGLLGATVWFTGLPGSGKSTIANAVAARLLELGRPAYVLDGDNLRHGLNVDLGFSAADREENVRRVGAVAELFADAGLVALVPVISPYRAGRAEVRAGHERSGLRFVEVFVDTPLELCERRDPKGLYARARAGELTGMTGIDDPYEEPLEAELRLVPGELDSSVGAVVALLAAGGGANTDDVVAPPAR